MSKFKILIYIYFVFYISSTFSMDMGVNAPLFKMNNYDLGEALARIKNSNIKYVRVDLPWRNVESKRDFFEIYPRWDFIINRLVSMGVKPILVLGYPNEIYSKDKPKSKVEVMRFVKYVDFVSKHYNNKVYYYEIWNEWDSKLGGGDVGNVQDYGRVLSASYTVIKKNNSKNKVLGGGFTSNTFDSFEGLGPKNEIYNFIKHGFLKYLDIVSIHPYTTSKPEPFNSYEYFVKQVIYVKNLIEKSSYPHKEIFITEMGWSTANSGYAVGEEKQYYYLNKAICDSKSIKISSFIIYDLRNDFQDNGTKGNNAAAFGLYYFDWKPKPSAAILKKVTCIK